MAFENCYKRVTVCICRLCGEYVMSIKSERFPWSPTWCSKAVQKAVDKKAVPTIVSLFLSTAFGTAFGAQNWAP